MNETIRKIREKLKSGNLDFSETEELIIITLSSLTEEYLEAWAEDGNLWKEYLFCESILNNNNLQNITNNKKKATIVKNIIFSLGRIYHELNVDNIYKIFSYYNISNSYCEKTLDEYAKYLKNGEYSFTNEYVDNQTLQFLLEHNLKNAVENINSLYNDELSKEIYDKYLKYCKKNSIKPIFAVIKTEELKYNIDNFLKIEPRLLDNLFKIYSAYSSIIGNFDEEKNLFLNTLKALPVPIIYDKIGDVMIPKSIYENQDLFIEISDILCKKGFPYFVNDSSYNDNDKYDIMYEYCFNNEQLDYEILSANLMLIEEKKYFDRFLETGNLTILLDSIYASFIPEHIEEIVEKYKTNQKEQELLKDYNKPINNLQLAELLAKEGFLKILNLNINISALTEEDINSIKNIITKYNATAYLEYSLLISPTLETLLIECGKIKELIKYKMGKSTEDLISFINKYYNETIKLINEDPVALIDILIVCPQAIIRTELVNYFKELPDEYSISIFEKIAANENVKKLPSEDLEKYYNLYIENIARIYNVDIEKVEKIKKALGPKIILYLEEDNIKNILKMEDEELDKILAIFITSPLTIKELEQIFISLREYTFKIERPNDAEIFNNIRTAIREDDMFSIESYYYKLKSVFDEKLFERLNKKYQLNEMGYNPQNYYKIIQIIFDKIKDPEKEEKYSELLHEICDYYVETKRTEFCDIKNMGSLLELNYKTDPKILEEKIVKFIIKQDSSYNREEILTDAKDEFVKQGFKEEIFDEVVALISGMKDAKDISGESKKCIKTVRNIIISIVKKYDKIEYYETTLINWGWIDRVYHLEGTKNIEVIEILKELNINQIKKIISNPRVYEKLLEQFQKRKIHLIPDEINKILSETDLAYNPELITQLINFFQEICQVEIGKEIRYISRLITRINEKLLDIKNDKLKERLLAEKEKLEKELIELRRGKIPEIRAAAALVDADSFFAASSVFSLILGAEDARLIRKNPPNHAATLKIKNNERLKESVELTKLLFTRDEITIPPFDENVELSNARQIRVTAGNFTDPCNLTHGERTGACSRLGGPGESLFYYALKDKNGFQVKFSNPETGEYVSRITGFRNGNTVFLNQLRESLSDEYVNEDLIIAVKKFAEHLIEESKNSSYPIENVIASKDIVLVDEPIVDLQIEQVNKNIDLEYTDIKAHSCVVLATSAKDAPFVPVNLSQNNLPIYKPIRRQKKVITNKKDLATYVNRVESVKAILNGQDYQTLTYFYNNEGFQYAIANDEWYIYVDYKGVIHKNCITIDKRAEEEFLIEVEKVEQQLADKKEDDDKWSLS